jgi:hypothetical protein
VAHPENTMRKLLILACLGQLGACGGASSDQNTTPAPDTVVPAAPAVRPDTQPMPQPDVTIATDTRSYRAGDPVALKITNSSTRRFTYNPCTRTLEREDDGVAGKWAEVKEDRMCTMIAHVLDPNSTRNEQTELGEELAPGRYRMLVRFANDSPSRARKATDAVSVTAYSAPFTVTSTR